jgi:hypothetical protein
VHVDRVAIQRAGQAGASEQQIQRGIGQAQPVDCALAESVLLHRDRGGAGLEFVGLELMWAKQQGVRLRAWAYTRVCQGRGANLRA